MNLFQTYLDKIYTILLSEKTKQKGEYFIITIAILSFLIHLLLIVLNDFNALPSGISKELLNNPIAAIYTPFSFILLYEVYLLVYYLPKSTSQYINKQYEIIALVVIRRIFKDISNIDLNTKWFENNYDLMLSYDLITTIVLLSLIVVFNRLSKSTDSVSVDQFSPRLQRFIRQKKTLALTLVPIFIGLAIYSLYHWILNNVLDNTSSIDKLTDINDIFFNEFFTILILSDVLLLLFSLYHTDKFSKVIRNSGFIISTILIRLSFAATGLTNDIIIIAAVVFGVLILIIHNLFEYKSVKKVT
ncbi:MAG: hypothetical protein HKN99_02655 [Winogradskyella sp.]|nr:hypothetical protein [Winogradskyella sp.]NNK40381.1 hypothetical protein [Winogradskyella sp.]